MLYAEWGGLISPDGLLHLERASDLRWVLADTFCMQHWCLDGGTQRNRNIPNCVVMLSEPLSLSRAAEAVISTELHVESKIFQH